MGDRLGIPGAVSVFPPPTSKSLLRLFKRKTPLNSHSIITTQTHEGGAHLTISTTNQSAQQKIMVKSLTCRLFIYISHHPFIQSGFALHLHYSID